MFFLGLRKIRESKSFEYYKSNVSGPDKRYRMFCYIFEKETQISLGIYIFLNLFDVGVHRQAVEIRAERDESLFKKKKNKARNILTHCFGLHGI